jgi:hypothetical protein
LTYCRRRDIYILQPGTDYFRNLSLSLSLMPDRIKST